METLSNELKIKIMKYIPRRINPTAIIMKSIIKYCSHYYNPGFSDTSFYEQMVIYKKLKRMFN